MVHRTTSLRAGNPHSRLAIATLLAAAFAAPLAIGQTAPAAKAPEAQTPATQTPAPKPADAPKAQGAPSSGTTAAVAAAAATTKITASQLGISYESYSSGIPQRDTVARMMRVLSVDVTEQRLEDVANFLIETTGADLEFVWGDGFSGLDKEKLITVKATNRTALQLLELVLDKAAADIGTGATWQMTDSGTMQAGTKDSLNKFKRLEVYPIADLMLETPNYEDAPIFDLQQAFQQASGGRGGGGGGGQSPFRQQGNQEGPERTPEQDRAEEVVDIIRTLVEPEQWDSGGASIRYWQKTLLVNAPDYIHRQLNGYPWWPKPATTSVARAGGGRYVTLGIDTGITGLPEFQPLAVTGTAGGGGAPGTGGGSGGGGQTPPGGGG